MAADREIVVGSLITLAQLGATEGEKKTLHVGEKVHP